MNDKLYYVESDGGCGVTTMYKDGSPSPILTPNNMTLFNTYRTAEILKTYADKKFPEFNFSIKQK